MRHKKIFAAIAVIVCTIVLVAGCNITPHEDVMKSEPATIEQTENVAQNNDKNVVKDAQRDDSDKTSDAQSNSIASADKSDKDADKESGASADQSSSDASKSDSSASKPSGNSSASKPNSSGSHSGTSASKPSTGNSSASKPSGNTGSGKPSSGNSGSISTPAPSQPVQETPAPHVHDYTSSVTTQPTCTQPGVRTFTCSCGKDSYTESIPATGHSWVDNVQTVEHSDPVWKVVCNGCGAQFDTADEAGDHVMMQFGDACENYSSKIVGYNTYSETVTVGQICSVCGATK